MFVMPDLSKDKPASRLLTSMPNTALFGMVLLSATNAAAAPASDALKTFANNHCVRCHNTDTQKGKLDLQSVLADDMAKHTDVWQDVAGVLRHDEMPPEDEPQPTDAESKQVLWEIAEAFSDTPNASKTSESGDPGSFMTMIGSHCVSCHNPQDPNGKLDLESILQAPVSTHAATWEKVLLKIDARQMPPAGKRRPSEAGFTAMVDGLTQALDAAGHASPGTTDTFRRLNRTEYQNAIRDLLALDVDAQTLLPADESSHGFDNITVTNLSPALLTRYVSAAQKIARLAIGTPRTYPDAKTYRVKPDITQEGHVPGLPLGTRGGMVVTHNFPRDGEYEVAVRLMRDRDEKVEGLSGTHQLHVLVDKTAVAEFIVKRPKGGPVAFDDSQLVQRFDTTAGPHQLGVTFARNNRSLEETRRQPLNVHFNVHRHPRLAPAIYEVSITGPLVQKDDITQTPSRAKLFVATPESAGSEQAAAQAIIQDLVRRAYRGNVTKEDLAGPMAFYQQGYEEGGFDAGIESALAAVLVSPRFLFKIERTPANVNPGDMYPLNDFEIARRLALFLWSSIPDEPLLADAERGLMKDPKVLEKHVRRMLADERAMNLGANFSSQWLHLRNLDAKTPDARLFPDFDDNLRQAMRRETQLHFEAIVRQDLSVLDLIDADHTYLNERLAKHYGIPHIYGSRFRRVDLPEDSKRGGLFRQGSILTVTSYATRTSPVIRGNWILENILGAPAPPPPDDVPSLDAQKQISGSLTVRERLAKHRENPVCASCHDIMDPVGFALENFDAVGRWRYYESGAPVDASGGLPDGSTFTGVAGLEAGVLERPDLFVAAFTEKLMTFGLGRGMNYQDRPAIRQIVRQAADDDYHFSTIALGIVQSQSFLMRTAQ